jgi:hypothetical protein
MPQRFSLHRHESDTIQTLLTAEGYLLELIFTGAPLPAVLDRLCSAIDAQVGSWRNLCCCPCIPPAATKNEALIAADVPRFTESHQSNLYALKVRITGNKLEGY